MLDFKRDHKHDFDKQSVLDHFEVHQQQLRQRKLSNKKRRNLLRQKLRAAKLELDDDAQYKQIKDLYINAFKQANNTYDLNDPRENHLIEVREYDILESEDETPSDSE